MKLSLQAPTRARLWLALLAAGMLLSACTRIGIPEGWPEAVVDGDTIYVGTMAGDFRAIDLDSGLTVWKFDRFQGEEDRHAVYGPPALYDGNVYFAGYDGMLYALTQGGVELWNNKEVGDVSPLVGGPAAADGLVFVGSSDGNLYAFDAEDGSQEWAFPTGNRVWSTPVAQDGVVYFGSLDHNVYAVNAVDGTEKWRFDARGGVTARPLVHGGRVYVGSFASVFYALDAETGAVAWRFDGANGWFWGGASAGDGQVFAPSLDGSVYALNAGTGDLEWRFDGARGPIIGTPSGTPAIPLGTSEPATRLQLLQTCDRVKLNRPQLWAVSPAAYASRDPGLSGDLEVGDYLDIITPEPNEDGLIQVQVSTHDSRKLEGAGDEPRVWIEWGRIEAAGSIESVFECEGGTAPPGDVAAAVDESAQSSAAALDASKFKRLAVGSADGRVWLVDLAEPSNVNSCDVGKPIKASVTATGDILIVASIDHSIRALAVTPSGADEKWNHRTDRPDPIVSGEEKAC